jgi:hypothetical protein
MRLSGKIMSEATDVEFGEIPAIEAGRTLRIEGEQAPQGNLYKINSEPEPKSQPSPETAATAPADEEKAATGLVDFGTNEEPEKKDEKPVDPFVAKAKVYEKEINNEKLWNQLLRMYGMIGKPLSELAEDQRASFLDRCNRTVDKKNMPRK